MHVLCWQCVTLCAFYKLHHFSMFLISSFFHFYKSICSSLALEKEKKKNISKRYPLSNSKNVDHEACMFCVNDIHNVHWCKTYTELLLEIMPVCTPDYSSYCRGRNCEGTSHGSFSHSSSFSRLFCSGQSSIQLKSLNWYK